MIAHARKQFNSYWEAWAQKRNRPGNPQLLNSHNVYILPSRFGWVFALVVLTLLSAAINYQINTIFLMAFLLVIAGMASAWEAVGNLKNLAFEFIVIEDTQQGTPAKLTLFIHPNNKIRYSLDFRTASQPIIHLETIPQEGIQIVIPIETPKRGYLSVPRVIISSLFPLGIFRIWAYAYFKEQYYVYPQPIDPGFWPDYFIDQHAAKKHRQGDEELYDLKQTENPWLAPNLIAWKVAAKGQGWYLKTMDSNEADCWLFKLSDLPGNNIELKLQQLSYWLQTAETNGQIYGLELSTTRTSFSRGNEHLQHCLRQLALYQ